jgi:hypothetical protein
VELRPGRAVMCVGWAVKGSERAGARVVKVSERGARGERLSRIFFYLF